MCMADVGHLSISSSSLVFFAYSSNNNAFCNKGGVHFQCYLTVLADSSKCDPDRTVVLETTINPIFVDLPNFTGLRDV